MSEIKFKSVQRKHFRKRKMPSDEDSDSETEESPLSAVEDLKELQKLRQRQKGVNALSLAEGKVPEKEEKPELDPFKMKTGGFIDMKKMKHKLITVEDTEQIGTSFAAETNRRDEDADMIKYVEEQLAKAKGVQNEDEKDATNKPKNAVDQLYELPESIRDIANRKKTEDMLSNQMLSGIPEVDLGIHAKIRNIEATEEAKAKMLQERLNKRDTGISEFVPTNMAVNFVQHKRFTVEDMGPAPPKKVDAPKPAPARVGDYERPQSLQGSQHRQSKSRDEKATDDFHYEKFKKQLRRY